MSKPIIIIGDGRHAAVLVEILISQNRKVIGYTSLRSGNKLSGLPYLGKDNVIATYGTEEIELVLGLGTVNVATHRKKIFEMFITQGYTFANVVHSSTIISPSVQVGQGVQIMAGSVLQTNVRVLENTIINTGTIIDHDCFIGKHTHIAPGTTLSGGVRIGENCHVGTGTSIIQGITIGNETLIGAGSVVVSNVGNKKKAFGVPAKEV